MRSLRLCNGRLYFLKGNVSGSHFNSSQFCSIKLGAGDGEEVTVHQQIAFARHIISSGHWVYFDEPERSNLISRMFDTTDNSFEKLEGSILDAKDNLVVLKKSTPTMPNTLLFRHLLNNGSNHELVVNLATLPESLSLVLSTSNHHTLAMGEHMEAIVVRPAVSNGSLVVMPHGGPNSNYESYFCPFIANFLSRDFTVLVVNYTGSIGFGREGIELLEGAIGEADVGDIITAIEGARQEFGDFKKIFLFGGSHGGYIAAMLCAKHPNMFSGCIMRNPVIDLQTMSVASDIMDWTFGQLGLPYDLQAPRAVTADEAARIFERSPIAHVDHVKTPTLVLIGEQDKRVPPFQGRAWHYWLKGKGVPSTLHSFPDTGHSLDSPTAAMRSLLIVNEFLNTHHLGE